MTSREYAEDELYEEDIRLSKIKEEMYEARKTAETKISAIVHPEYVEDFSRILCTAWNTNDVDANFIAEKFDLSRKDFVAIEGDLELFTRICLDEWRFP